VPGPEEKVAERVALAQIWPRLRPVHCEVLTALAACGDYGLAAESLGKSRKTFTQQISTARREFLALSRSETARSQRPRTRCIRPHRSCFIRPHSPPGGRRAAAARR
jgi:hypothetical protein